MTLHFSRRALALAALLLPLPLMAQWSKTPDSNLVIGDGPSEQVKPKLAPLADGGFYVSWFDNAAGGYDVRLQRLDIKGRPQWGHNGRLLADRGLVYTTDYSLDVDGQGNALLAFHDISQADGRNYILVSKVAADGTPLWGNASGLIRLPGVGGTDPRIVGTSDGGAVVAWSGRDNKIALQKLDADGVMQWGAQNIEVSPPTTNGYFHLADMKATPDGGVIIGWSAYFGRYDVQYWTQKFDRDGHKLWGDTHLRLWDATANGNGMLQVGYLPKLLSDGQGGAVYCWDVSLPFSIRVRAQHVSAEGVERFGHGGVLVSTDEVNNRGNCSASYDQAADDIYVLWRENTPHANTMQAGIFAQRIDGTGQRQWGDVGNLLMPIDPIPKSQVTMVPEAGGFVAAWALEDYPRAMPIQAMRVTKDGGYGWSNGIVGIKTSSSDTGQMVGALSADGYATFAWVDHRATGNGDVVVQNIGRDGVLGKKEPGATGK